MNLVISTLFLYSLTAAAIVTEESSNLRGSSSERNYPRLLLNGRPEDCLILTKESLGEGESVTIAKDNNFVTLTGRIYNVDKLEAVKAQGEQNLYLEVERSQDAFWGQAIPLSMVLSNGGAFNVSLGLSSWDRTWSLSVLDHGSPCTSKEVPIQVVDLF